MLIIYLSPTAIKLYFSTSFNVSDLLVIDDVEFHLDSESKENDGFIGFFDWLRESEFGLVGVRLCFFEHHGYTVRFARLPYVKLTFAGKCIEIIFSGEKYNEDMSGDQDFAYNYVYKSFGEEYLITFNLDHLTERELDSLLPFCISF